MSISLWFLLALPFRLPHARLELIMKYKQTCKHHISIHIYKHLAHLKCTRNGWRWFGAESMEKVIWRKRNCLVVEIVVLSVVVVLFNDFICLSLSLCGSMLSNLREICFDTCLLIFISSLFFSIFPSSQSKVITFVWMCAHRSFVWYVEIKYRILTAIVADVIDRSLIL